MLVAVVAAAAAAVLVVKSGFLQTIFFILPRIAIIFGMRQTLANINGKQCDRNKQDMAEYTTLAILK